MSHERLNPNNNQARLCTEQGRIISALSVILAAGCFGLLVLAYGVFGQVVPPNAIGVRQNNFSVWGLLRVGFQDQGLTPGLHWQIPRVSKVHLLPRDFQFVHLIKDPPKGDIALPPLEISTFDGSKVKTDFTLVFRYFDAPGKAEEENLSAGEGRPEQEVVPFALRKITDHGGPKELLNSYTLLKQRQLEMLSTKVEDFLRRSLNTLSGNDYYNPVLREKLALQAVEQANQTVNREGAELWAALIQRYVYSERNIEDQIFAKNLQQQTEHLNAALSGLAEARAKTEQTRAMWDANILSLQVEGNSKIKVINSEASRYEQDKVAQGNKLVELALAEIEEQKNSAYAAPGGQIFVARGMLPLLSMLSGGVISGIQPFDISSWIKRLTGGIDTQQPSGSAMKSTEPKRSNDY